MEVSLNKNSLLLHGLSKEKDKYNLALEVNLKNDDLKDFSKEEL